MSSFSGCDDDSYCGWASGEGPLGVLWGRGCDASFPVVIVLVGCWAGARTLASHTHTYGSGRATAEIQRGKMSDEKPSPGKTGRTYAWCG